jgi:hypothetical protein
VHLNLSAIIMGFTESVLSLVTVTNILLAPFLYVILKFVYQIVYYRFFHPLSKFPGPFWASVTRLWIAKQNLAETEYLTFHELSKTYGT